MSEAMITAKAHPPAEGYVLARAMARARTQMIEFYDKHELHDKQLSLRKVIGHEQDKDFAEKLVGADPEHLSWFGMNNLTACGMEDAAAMLWSHCLGEALDEFDTGHRAASIIDRWASPLQRARFIAIRDAFREDWQPRGATELVLVDHLAQAHYMWEKWLATHIMRIDMECWRDPKDDAREEHKWIRPRQNEVEATREAADMADRWQKTFLRTVRALRDLRRFASPVVIQNAGQSQRGESAGQCRLIQCTHRILDISPFDSTSVPLRVRVR